jgi:2'-5' RNA ligase
MRLFVGITFGADAEQAIGSAVDGVRATAPRARWVRAVDLHLTLSFLGDVDEAKLAPTSEALSRAARAARPFTLSAASAGAFGPSASPRVLWLGARGATDALATLRRDVATGLESVGHSLDARPHAPHITLARARPRIGDPALAECVAALAGFEAPRSPIHEICLMQSGGHDGPSRYRALGRFVLGG